MGCQAPLFLKKLIWKNNTVKWSLGRFSSPLDLKQILKTNSFAPVTDILDKCSSTNAMDLKAWSTWMLITCQSSGWEFSCEVSWELSPWPSQITWFSWYHFSFYPVWHDICKADSVKKMSIHSIEMIQDTMNNVFAIVLTLASIFTESSSEMLPTTLGLVPTGCSSWVNRLCMVLRKAPNHFSGNF